MRLSKDEVASLRMIFYHLRDATWGDSRPDHGLAKLEDVREEIEALYRKFENSHRLTKIKEAYDTWKCRCGGENTDNYYRCKFCAFKREYCEVKNAKS